MRCTQLKNLIKLLRTCLPRTDFKGAAHPWEWWCSRNNIKKVLVDNAGTALCRDAKAPGYACLELEMWGCFWLFCTGSKLPSGPRHVKNCNLNVVSLQAWDKLKWKLHIQSLLVIPGIEEAAVWTHYHSDRVLLSGWLQLSLAKASKGCEAFSYSFSLPHALFFSWSSFCPGAELPSTGVPSRGLDPGLSSQTARILSIFGLLSHLLSPAFLGIVENSRNIQAAVSAPLPTSFWNYAQSSREHGEVTALHNQNTN